MKKLGRNLAFIVFLLLVNPLYSQIMGLQVEFMNPLSFNFTSQADLDNGLVVTNHASISIMSDVTYNLKVSAGVGNFNTTPPGLTPIPVGVITYDATPTNFGGASGVVLTQGLSNNLINESQSFRLKNNGSLQARNPKDNTCNWAGFPSYPCRTYFFDASCNLGGLFPEAGTYPITVLYTLSPQ